MYFGAIGRRLTIRVNFNEAVLGAKLDAGRVGLQATLLHRPTVETFSPHIQRSVRIPNHVTSGIGAVIVGRGGGEVGIVYGSVRVDRARPQLLAPIVLIGSFNTQCRRRFQVRAYT